LVVDKVVRVCNLLDLFMGGRVFGLSGTSGSKVSARGV
jgi:hypothetical protein